LALLIPPRPSLLPYTTLFRSRAGSSTGRHSRWTGPSSPCDGATPRSCGSGGPTGVRTVAPSPRGGWGFLTEGTSTSLDSTRPVRSEEHTSELQSRVDLVCRLL